MPHLYLVLCPVYTDTHSLFNICRSHFIAKTDNKFCYLLYVDHVFGVFCVWIDDLGTPSNLQAVALHQLHERARHGQFTGTYLAT